MFLLPAAFFASTCLSTSARNQRRESAESVPAWKHEMPEERGRQVRGPGRLGEGRRGGQHASQRLRAPDGVRELPGKPPTPRIEIRNLVEVRIRSSPHRVFLEKMNDWIHQVYQILLIQKRKKTESLEVEEGERINRANAESTNNTSNISEEHRLNRNSGLVKRIPQMKRAPFLIR